MNAVWKIEIEQTVIWNGNIYEITHLLDFNSVLGKRRETGKFEKLNISDLQLIVDSEYKTNLNLNNPPSEEINLESVSEVRWNNAVQRSESVKRITRLHKVTKNDVDQEAALLGVSRATMYRYINLFAATGKISSLLPNTSSGGRGKTRLIAESETILEATINEFYLTKQNRKVQKVIREYKRRCFNAGVQAAHDNTVRNRIKGITDKDKIRNRQGKRALQRILPMPGEFPEGNFPFEVVQIDHTPVDLQIVDDVTRLPIGRIWLTVIIEIFSRMILGFYLSPDAPSINSVGMCVSQAVIPKEKDLQRLDIKGEWNCWGLMSKIHADNAGEFRSQDIQRACQEYGIDIEWRPVGRPHYGAHIERLLGTFMREVHELPGTTFSNVESKGDYNSEKEAVFTFTEFEKWLTTYVTGVYHKTLHTGIGMPPEVKFEQGLFIGNNDFGPIGIPPKIMDERKFRIDFLPMEERTIQQFGVEIDSIRYYDSVLNPYIGAKDVKMPKYARKFIFKRNPRDLQTIFFYHPELKQYFEIPYRNLANPSITIWDLKAARNNLKGQGIKVKSEEQIFEALTHMRIIEDNATENTKSARRSAQRQRIYDEQNKRFGDPKHREKVVDSDNSGELTKTQPATYSNFLGISEDEIDLIEVHKF